MGGYSAGVVPEFRQASRSRGTTALGVSWVPEGPARLDLHWNYLWDENASGESFRGPGDVRLGTDLQLVDRDMDLHLGWQVKLPNASDELELGTDETDSTLWLRARTTQGGVDLGLTAGLAILGNPLQFANQDDVPLTWIDLAMPLGTLQLSGRVGGGWATARNPARMEASVGLEAGCPWLVGARVLKGITPAAPDWGARVWVGWGLRCPA